MCVRVCACVRMGGVILIPFQSWIPLPRGDGST